MVHYALGELYAELGEASFDRAREHYLAALRSQEAHDEVPIRVVEQLANLEARSGELLADEERIESAVRRLHGLVELGATPGPNPERAGLLGSAWKRLAVVRARHLLEDRTPGDGTRLLEALDQAIKAYGQVGEEPYPLLNRLALEAVRRFPDPADPAPLELARTCARQARQAFRRSPDFWNAVLPADALMSERVLDHSLAAGGKSGESAFIAVQQAYADALEHAPATPRERDSVGKQLHGLEMLFRARARMDARGRRKAAALADRLGLLAAQMLGPESGLPRSLTSIPAPENLK